MSGYIATKIRLINLWRIGLSYERFQTQLHLKKMKLNGKAKSWMVATERHLDGLNLNEMDNGSTRDVRIV